MAVAALVAVALLVVVDAAAAQSAADGRTLAQARAYLEAEQPAAALELLAPLAATKSATAETLLLLSTAHFMLGETAQGRAALDRSIELDPTLRQAWLNRAALDLAEGLYDDALKAFFEARELDPGATDNDLNLGATLMLKGDVGGASRHFNRYLSLDRGSADAYYLVATNYALGGQWELAVQHLEAAVRLDEKSRRRSRTDPNFGPLAEYPPFQALLETDTFQPGAGAHARSVTFDEAYDGGGGKLLKGVLNALQLSGRPFDSSVEVTAGWALVWSDVRLKLSDAPSGGGLVLMTAPAGSFSTAEWTRQTDDLIGHIREQLALLALRRH
jgi:tetratricopeptide (TPR) repeat protein